MNGNNYEVKLFDSNSLSGIWQMVGVLGLKDIASENALEINSTESNIQNNEPYIPEKDIELDLTDIKVEDNKTYDESGFSESSIDIKNVFDTNLSNSSFDSLDDGENGWLSIYGYDNRFLDKWLYFNSQSSSNGNSLNRLESGKGYWAKYQDNKFVSEKEDELFSNAGFIFSNEFGIGTQTYSGKIISGWNLLSIPEKRSVEIGNIIIIKYNQYQDYNFAFSKKDELSKKLISLNKENISDAVKKINIGLVDSDIFAINSKINEDNNYITFISNKKFKISNLLEFETLSVFNEENKIVFEVYSDYIFGTILDINKDLISAVGSVFLKINDKDINLALLNSESLEDDISTINFLTEDKNLQFFFSRNVFSIENMNYLKRYENNSLFLPDGFLSIDKFATIFQISENRKNINLDYKLIQNNSDYKLIKGYLPISDLINQIIFDGENLIYPNLLNFSKYLKTYDFPKENNLKFFLSQIYGGYLPTQILTLKTDIANNVKWDSIPISKNISDWLNSDSNYDNIIYADKRKSYWVKFVEKVSLPVNFLIDREQSSIYRYVTHQISKDNKSINNVIHYTIQIFLKNVSKSVRGYLSFKDFEIELKPELDGSVFSVELDFENLSEMIDLDLATEIIVNMVDENGFEESINFEVNFKKPEIPDSYTKFEDTIYDKSLRIYKDDLRDFNMITDIHSGLCLNFIQQDIFFIKTDINNYDLSENRLILSDPLIKNYISLYKSSSKLISNNIIAIENPIKYGDNCNEIVGTQFETEGVKISLSQENIEMFYMKENEFVSETLHFPRVMFIEINENIVKIEFNYLYDEKDFYIVDSNKNVFYGKFISELHNNNQSPYVLKKLN